MKGPANKLLPSTLWIARWPLLPRRIVAVPSRRQPAKRIPSGRIRRRTAKRRRRVSWSAGASLIAWLVAEG